MIDVIRATRPPLPDHLEWLAPTAGQKFTEVRLDRHPRTEDEMDWLVLVVRRIVPGGSLHTPHTTHEAHAEVC